MFIYLNCQLLSSLNKEVRKMNEKKTKVVKGVALTGELWNRIEEMKSSQMSRSTYIGVAVEDYIKRVEA